MPAGARVRDLIRVSTSKPSADSRLTGTFLLYDPEKDTIFEQAPRFTVVGDRAAIRP
jgi:hypothetical protein